MKLIKLLISAILILLIVILPVYAADNHNSLSPAHNADNSKTIPLSQYTEKHSFTDKGEIEIIAKEYDLENPESIDEIIYIPLDDEMVDENKIPSIVPYEVGKNEFYIKNISKSEQKGSLLQSSWFRYPGGKMEISDKVAISVTFNAQAGMKVGIEVVEAELKAALGFSVTGSRSINNSQTVKVKSGCKRNVKAYVNLGVYKYELWEDDPVSDDYYGSGTVKRPIGVVFTMGDNVVLK